MIARRVYRPGGGAESCQLSAYRRAVRTQCDWAWGVAISQMLPLNCLSAVPDATAAAAPMARLKLALPTGSPFAGGTLVTIQFRWSGPTNLTGHDPPVCRFGKLHAAAELLGDSMDLHRPAAYGSLQTHSLLCYAPACKSPRCLPSASTVRRPDPFNPTASTLPLTASLIA